MGDPALAREALQAQGDVLEGSLPPHMERLLGPSSSAVVHGEQHAALRHMFMPALSAEAVERYIPRQAISGTRQRGTRDGKVFGWGGMLAWHMVVRTCAGGRYIPGPHPVALSHVYRQSV